MRSLHGPAVHRRVDDLIEFRRTEAVGGLHRDAEAHRHDEPGQTPRVGVARQITLVDGAPEALLKADPRGGSHLLIEAGSCGITISVEDRARIPFPALERMVKNMTFGGCDDTSDWLPIIGS